ncbi:hypothetical protein G4Y79_21885 [Phototrophicus methaneseepsis]|uniref:Uncharacterized protein n=2 Tax=Phototrophicus methaneseepsis TaxID=2710758 RepID=A0A7S8IGZ4_9CHLR|nr:hypothetical protein G4Y79_21885 [Phototrophicus methaneseepsis]
MRRGICPKCSHATVYSGQDLATQASNGSSIPIDFRHQAVLVHYVCVECGYVESYISDRSALARIYRQWPLPLANNKR